MQDALTPAGRPREATKAQTITKLAAAASLLGTAIDRYLDHGDYLAAIVLAGSAEDILQDLLAATSRADLTACQQHAEATLGIVQLPEGGGVNADPLTQSKAFARMRFAFNWLRHANRATDPSELTGDLHHETREIIGRAINNLYYIAGCFPARVGEFDSLERSK